MFSPGIYSHTLWDDDVQGRVLQSGLGYRDSDTQAGIAGAPAFYGPLLVSIVTLARSRLPREFLRVLDEFWGRFMDG